jgi:hypothetical protein
MTIFNLNNEYNIVCNSESTRYGFRHLVTLCFNGRDIAKAKACYYNRTWERFEFESVINKVIRDNFTGEEQAKFLAVVNNSNGY